MYTIRKEIQKKERKPLWSYPEPLSQVELQPEAASSGISRVNKLLEPLSVARLNTCVGGRFSAQVEGGQVEGGQGVGWGVEIPIALRREVLSLLSWGRVKLGTEDAAPDQLLWCQRLLALGSVVNLRGQGRLREGILWPLEVVSLLNWGRRRLRLRIEDAQLLLFLERHERAAEVVNLLGRGRLREGVLLPLEVVSLLGRGRLNGETLLLEELATHYPAELPLIIRHCSLRVHFGGYEGPERLSREGSKLLKGHLGPELLLSLMWPSRLRKGHRSPKRLGLEWPSRLRKGHRRGPIEALKASRQSAAALPGLFIEDADCIHDEYIPTSPHHLLIPLPVGGATLKPLPQSVGVHIFVFARLWCGPEIPHGSPLEDLVGGPLLPLGARRLRPRSFSAVVVGDWSRGRRGREGLRSGREGLRGGVGRGGARSRVNHVGYKGVFKI
jgi:hypothetical protein